MRAAVDQPGGEDATVPLMDKGNAKMEMRRVIGVTDAANAAWSAKMEDRKSLPRNQTSHRRRLRATWMPSQSFEIESKIK